ncbi:MerR family transcriptional regulator [Xaviernesmea oryzae]|uniref:MerR family transcriptional regulator n=1 Tax=Xaviernesmea oryzae TaxID=464029 RepID=A0A1Q9AXZ8_9HYPH|nr:helix-turn-helix domain-containing protein [Xaviernesmea oryzae]OLP60310.1 MerR family transcriptional regulator [Xaviernesmea oryzae]
MAGAGTIGWLSKRTGVKIPTIRYYEQVGLLPEAERSEAGQRLYGHDEADRLAFIRHARELGFDLKAIRALLLLQDRPQQTCHEADAIARARLTEVEDRIAKLMALKTELERMVAACAHGSVADCKVIETLAAKNHTHGPLAEG